MEILARAAELEDQGHDVIHMEVGEPDFATAPPIVAAGQTALQAGHTRYTPATGIPALREEIARHYAQMGVDVGADRIIITAGASAGLTLLASLLLNPGDEVLTTDPGYPCNEVFIRAAGGLPTPVPVTPDAGFQPDAEDIVTHWGTRTVAALLASPANPTGTMLGVEELHAIKSAIEARQGTLIVDEIYQGITRDAAYPSVLSLDLGDIYVLNSFSKFFGMTGWRLGWLVVPEAAIAPLTALAQNLFICPSAPAQHAALAALQPDCMKIHRQRVEAFTERCRCLHDGLLACGFSVPVYPQGAFYLYVDVSHTGMDSQTFCARLLEDYFVACTPGVDFGEHQADRYVRFAYAADIPRLNEALARIRAALQAWGVI